MKIIRLSLALWFFTLFAFASSANSLTINLRSGKSVEGEIIEANDKFIRLDVGIGIDVTYFWDEVSSDIDKRKIVEAAAKKNVEKLLVSLFEYEVNSDMKKAAFSVTSSDKYDLAEIDKARKLFDWENFETEPAEIFHELYKNLSSDIQKTAAQRDFLEGWFTTTKLAYKNKSKVINIKDYIITKTVFNESFDQAEAIYSNAVLEKKLFLHKVNLKWLIYKEYNEKPAFAVKKKLD